MRILMLLLLALAWPSVAAAAPAPAAVKVPGGAVSQLVETHLRRAGRPGAQVVIVQGGRSTFAQAYGDCTLGRPMRMDDALPLGGLAQPVIAAAALKLDSTGRLDLDAPLGAAPGPNPVTPRGLMNGAGADPENHARLGLALSQASGQRLEPVMRAALFRPLGMTHAVMGTPAGGRCGHQPAFGIAFPRPEGRAEAGAMGASADDLSRFAWAALAARSTPDALLPNVLWDAKGGMFNGWRSDRWNGEPVFWREGRTDGFSSMIALLPQRDLAVVVSSNQGGWLRQDPVPPLVRDLVAQQQGLTPQGPAFPWERLVRFALLISMLLVAARAVEEIWAARETRRPVGVAGVLGALAFLAAPPALWWLLTYKAGVDFGLVWAKAPDMLISVVLFALSGVALCLTTPPRRRKAAASSPAARRLNLDDVIPDVSGDGVSV